eukprot:scaffold31420_cov59-Phaeocystis_antarctica.AAC.3
MPPLSGLFMRRLRSGLGARGAPLPSGTCSVFDPPDRVPYRWPSPRGLGGQPAVWAGCTCLRAGCAPRPPQGLWLCWGCRPSVPSTGTELGAGAVGLGARYCCVLRALGWVGASPPLSLRCPI